MVKITLRCLLTMFVMFTGVLHFVRPQPFVDIVPACLPCPLALVYISGVFEILGGIGLMIPQTRRYAAWGLIALFIAVFPANVNMALNRLPFMGEVHPVANWVRLPFQLVLIWWAYLYTQPDNSRNAGE
jgi:uncharacterized membrane protein